MIYIILAIICAILLTFYTIWQRFYTKYDVYLSGPMSITGRKDLNYPIFNEIAKKLRENGLTVFNPAEVTKAGTPHWKCMITDINAVVNRCKEVYCIEGWRKSPGANAEVFSAFMCGKLVYEINPYSWKNCKTIDLIPINTKSCRLPYDLNLPKEMLHELDSEKYFYD